MHFAIEENLGVWSVTFILEQRINAQIFKIYLAGNTTKQGEARTIAHLKGLDACKFSHIQEPVHDEDSA